MIFDQQLVVADEADLERVLQRVGETAWLEYVRGLDALEKDKKTGKLYADHLCYFSMLRAIPELRFEKFGKKDPRTGLYLLGQA